MSCVSKILCALLTHRAGALKMIRGQGMPSYRHHDFGNMYVQFDVKFPAKNFTTDPAAFDLLRQVLPSTVTSATPPKEAMSELADLEDVDASQQARATGAEDEDEEHQGGERVQCASQ